MMGLLKGNKVVEGPAETPATSESMTAEEILGIDDIVIESVYVPQWKKSVFIRSLSAADRGYLEEQIYQIDMSGQSVGANIKMSRMTSLLAFLSICDETGKRLFEKESQIDKLAGKSAAALNIIAEKAQELAGMSAMEVKKLTGALKNG